METTKKKTFDTVQMMRDIRDKVNAETKDMNFAELKAFMKKKISDSNFKPVGQQ